MAEMNLQVVVSSFSWFKLLFVLWIIGIIPVWYICLQHEMSRLQIKYGNNWSNYPEEENRKKYRENIFDNISLGMIIFGGILWPMLLLYYVMILLSEWWKETFLDWAERKFPIKK